MVRTPSSTRLPRSKRRPQTKTKVRKSATVAEQLAKILGTEKPAEQASIITGFISKWRTGEIDCPSVSPQVAKAKDRTRYRAANKKFLTWRLGRKDLAEAACKLLRNIEKVEERSLEYLPLRIPDDDPIVAGRSRLKIRPGHPLASAVLTSPSAGVEAFLRAIRYRVPFPKLSRAEQTAYASYIWFHLWDVSLLLCANPIRKVYSLGRDVRRRLLRVSNAVKDDPSLAVRRLVRLGLTLPHESLSAGVSEDVAVFLGTYPSVFYVHLVESGIELPDLRDTFLRYYHLARRPGQDPSNVCLESSWFFEIQRLRLQIEGLTPPEPQLVLEKQMIPILVALAKQGRFVRDRQSQPAPASSSPATLTPTRNVEKSFNGPKRTASKAMRRSKGDRIATG